MSEEAAAYERSARAPLRILALDPATQCGFAHSCGASGTWDLSVRKDESAGMRLIRMRAKLEEIRLAVGVDLVVYEAARYVGVRGGDRALAVQSMIQGAVLIWCEDNGFQYRAYSPSEVKKHATGKGNAKKDVVLAAARVRWPNVRGHDEADARWLLDLAEGEYGARVRPLPAD